MSIHCFLNSSATHITVERRTFDKIHKKSQREAIAKFDINTEFTHSDLTNEEIFDVNLFAHTELKKIREAFAINSANGLFGGIAVVSRGDRFNRQFRDLPGYLHGVPKGRFLGCIKDAYHFNLRVQNDSAALNIKERLENHTLTSLAKDIINTEIQCIRDRAEKFDFLTGIDCIDRNHAEQLLEISELLSAFLKHCKFNKKESLDYGIQHSVDEFIEELKLAPETAALGTKTRILDGDLLANRRNRTQAFEEAEARHEERKQALLQQRYPLFFKYRDLFDVPQNEVEEYCRQSNAIRDEQSAQSDSSIVLSKKKADLTSLS